jgi:hypothetical protein
LGFNILAVNASLVSDDSTLNHRPHVALQLSQVDMIQRRNLICCDDEHTNEFLDQLIGEEDDFENIRSNVNGLKRIGAIHAESETTLETLPVSNMNCQIN